MDLKEGLLRLDPGMGKTGKARKFYFTVELRELLEQQRQSLDALKATDTISPWVFHRSVGSPIKDLRGSWKQACEAAGYPGKLFHDLRRSAVRTLERSGVPRSASMAMVAHKTDAMYRRYAIFDETVSREAAAKIDAWVAEQQATAEAEKRGSGATVQEGGPLNC